MPLVLSFVDDARLKQLNTQGIYLDAAVVLNQDKQTEYSLFIGESPAEALRDVG